MRILGIDPGLTRMGYGLIDVEGNTLSYVHNGFFSSPAKSDLPLRLAFLFNALTTVIRTYTPDVAAVEETFLNPKASVASALVLGHARGVALVAPALADIPVYTYAPNVVKKALTGVGHAQKEQVQFMVQRLLPKALICNADSADALALAICHWHHYVPSFSVSKGAVQ